MKGEEHGDYRLLVESNPQVFNRRRYPRMPLSNPCTIQYKGSEEKYYGKLVNISANGFAFAVRDESFGLSKGKKVFLDVEDFDVLNGKELEGTIIRSSNNEGEYVVGCRMPEDNDAIKLYVSKNYSE